MRILVTGSRDWIDEEAIGPALWEASGGHIGPDVTLVHGDARGADKMAADWADTLCWRVEAHPADWVRHGKAAGMIRNAEMVKLGADMCLSFIRAGSRGATHCADLAEAAGIPTRRFTRD